MTPQESKRKLTAILSADVKGYSLLMSQNEEATVKTLKQYKATISGLVSEHRGRVVDSPGDNILRKDPSLAWKDGGGIYSCDASAVPGDKFISTSIALPTHVHRCAPTGFRTPAGVPACSHPLFSLQYYHLG